MILLLSVAIFHFAMGGFGIVLINRKLPSDKKKSNWQKYLVYLVIFIIILSSILINKKLFLGIAVIISAIGFLEIINLGKQPCRAISRDRFFFTAVAIFFIVIFFFSLFFLLPAQIIAYTYTIVIIFDGASQICGQIAGKKKILPVLSPNKTLEGLIGGTISALVTSVILHEFVGFTVFHSLIFGIIICAASFAGDLAASAYKRAFNAKDFGNTLPGQGGILDRFDSFLSTGAVAGLIYIPTIFSSDSIDMNIVVYLGYSLIYILILLSGELIHSVFSFKVEYSRIFSHILAGVVSVFMINLFTSHWYIISLSIQSATFLYLTKRMGLFMAHHNVERNTNGSSIFFIGILTAYFISKVAGDPSLYYLSITILTISDPVASMTGMNIKSGFWPRMTTGNRSAKTYSGSIGFFVSTLVILISGLTFFHTLPLWKLIGISAAVSFLTTIAEVICSDGADNLAIPLVASLSLAFLTVN